MTEETINSSHEIMNVTREINKKEEEAKKESLDESRKVNKEKTQISQGISEEKEMSITDIKRDILQVINEALEKAKKIKDEQRVKSLEELKEKINSAATRDELVSLFNEAKKIIRVIEEKEELINKLNTIVDYLEPFMDKLSPIESKRAAEFINLLEFLINQIKRASDKELIEVRNKIKNLEEQVYKFVRKLKEKEEEVKKVEKTVFPPELSEFIAIMEGEKAPEEEKSEGLEEEITKALEEMGVIRKAIKPVGAERSSLKIPLPFSFNELVAVIKTAIHEAFRNVLEEFTKLIRVEIRSLMRRIDQRLSEIYELITSLQVSKETIKEEIIEKKQKVIASKQISDLLSNIDMLINKVIPENAIDLVEYAIRLEACKLRVEDLIKKIGTSEIKVTDEVIKQIEEKRARLYERISRVRDLVEKVAGTIK